MDALIVKIEPMTLENLCGGRVAKQVDAALAHIAEAFEDESLQEGRTKLEGKLNVEIALELNTDTRTVKVSAKCNAKIPGPRAVSGVALFRNGGFHVEPDDIQEELPLRGSAVGGET